MQGDGNFVLYDAAGVPYWATGTWGNPGAWIILQDDGNLVVYAQNGAPLWAPNTTNLLIAGGQLNMFDRITSSTGRTVLEMQPDGNLVLTRIDDSTKLWESNTVGKPVTHAVMQKDGNFVLCDAAG